MYSRAWRLRSAVTTTIEPTAVPVVAHVASLADAPSIRRKSRGPARPNILGGPQAFPGTLPFCRPTRPLLKDVMARFEPSYEAGILTNGRLVAELEERTAERLGVRRVVAVSSCTSGLILSVQAVTEGATGHVVMPSFTFLASGHAVRWNGLLPRFVECDSSSFQMDLDHAARELDGASAILATHVFGGPSNPVAVEALGRSHGVPVVFDAAHAFGSIAAGRPVGGFGSAEVFSLTPTKVLVAGEGGLVATNDVDLAERIRIGRNYADPGTYDSRFVGLNARMSEYHAAMALVSLDQFDQVLRARRSLANQYRRLLSHIPGLSVQLVDSADESTFKDLAVVVDPAVFAMTRDQLVTCLAAEGIETRNYFDPPMHRQHAYAYLHDGELPVTDQVSSRIVNLPLYTDLSTADIDRVVDAVNRVHLHAEEIVGHLTATAVRSDQ